jgi:hypothetical protein
MVDYDNRYDPNAQGWVGGVAGPLAGTAVPKEPPMVALGRGMSRTEEMVSRLEQMADRLAGTRPEAVPNGLVGGKLDTPAIAHQINGFAYGLESMAQRMQNALQRIEQVFG